MGDGIDRIDAFNFYINKPPDHRFSFASTTTRDLLHADYRWEGMTAYCIADGTFYALIGGVNNTDWVAVGSASSVIDTDRAISIIPDGTNLGDPAMILGDFLEAAFYYDPPEIHTFSGGTTYEIGELTRATTLTWRVTPPDNYTVATVKISDDGGSSWSADLSTGGTVLNDTYVGTPGADTNTTYTIRATSNQTGVYIEDTESISFLNKIYWGVSATGTYNEAFIKALDDGGTTGDSAFDANYVKSFTVDAGLTDYIFFAVPKDYTIAPHLTPPYFFAGGFAGGFAIAQNDISYTYGGNTEPYILYKSANPNIGVKTISVQTTS